MKKRTYTIMYVYYIYCKTEIYKKNIKKQNKMGMPSQQQYLQMMLVPRDAIEHFKNYLAGAKIKSSDISVPNPASNENKNNRIKFFPHKNHCGLTELSSYHQHFGLVLSELLENMTGIHTIIQQSLKNDKRVVLAETNENEKFRLNIDYTHHKIIYVARKKEGGIRESCGGLIGIVVPNVEVTMPFINAEEPKIKTTYNALAKRFVIDNLFDCLDKAGNAPTMAILVAKKKKNRHNCQYNY